MKNPEPRSYGLSGRSGVGLRSYVNDTYGSTYVLRSTHSINFATLPPTTCVPYVLGTYRYPVPTYLL
jgi:hypothetical protein